MSTKLLARPEQKRTEPFEAAPTSQLKNKIQNRAMLVSLRVCSWTARTTDKSATSEIHKSNDADSDAGQYRKKLLPKEALAHLSALTIRARTEHYNRTLPWGDDGARILSAKGFLPYTAAINQLRDEFNQSADAFVTEYISFKDKARQSLGKLYNPADYPNIEDIRARFEMRTRILPFPAADDLRLDIDDETADEMRQQIRTDIEASLQVANNDIFLRAQTVLNALVDRMEKFKPATLEQRAQSVFRDSLIDNINELAESIPSLNITDNPEINKLAQQLADVASIEPDTLRRSRQERAATMEKANSILANLNGILA